MKRQTKCPKCGSANATVETTASLVINHCPDCGSGACWERD